jgi:8-oxo-dGTP pyrophosphatase MutT (NUDIX family)
MAGYNNVSFPPYGAWDRRLSDDAGGDLRPIESLHQNPWFAVRNRGGYFTVEYHLRQVAVLPVINEDSIVMVRVKRPVVGDVTLELPAGAIEKQEDSAAGASRELEEETGMVVSDLKRFVPMPPVAVSSTRTPRLSYVYRVDVSESEFAQRRPHDDEIQRVERVRIRDLPRMMARGDIYVSVTLAILGVHLCSTSRNLLSAQKRPRGQR